MENIKYCWGLRVVKSRCRDAIVEAVADLNAIDYITTGALSARVVTCGY